MHRQQILYPVRKQLHLPPSSIKKRLFAKQYHDIPLFFLFRGKRTGNTFCGLVIKTDNLNYNFSQKNQAAIEAA